MVTLQEQFEKDFPQKDTWEINIEAKYKNSNFTIDLSCSDNNLTSVEFLNRLPNLEKLRMLLIYNNNIKSTDIAFFSKFVNLKYLRIGTMKHALEKNKHNKFYGSLKSYQNLTKLESICIEATDVNEGLEYLSQSLVKSIKEVKKARPKLFFDPKIKTKWLSALRNKLNDTQSKLQEIKTNQPDKIKKTKRLETKIYNLKLIQENISNHSLIEKLETNSTKVKSKEMKDKATQTEEIAEPEKSMEMPGL
ncbi:10379_t:CDS:2 [Funneliformis geosporum]|nr:10379_t:CDS:2 [Funneliformis geosporum]